MRKLTILLSFLLCANVYSASFGTDDIQKLKWGDLEVIWLEDNRFPTYTMNVYFADGTLSDSRNQKGMTNAMFGLLPSGTRRFSQKDIADNLEFYGSSTGGSATHEQANYTISGLVKDMAPTLKKVCHLFDDASFPKKEIANYRKLVFNGLQSMVTTHGALASRIFREVSLAGTPYSYPTGGKIKDLKRIKQGALKKKLAYFNNKVKKRIYIYGPKAVLEAKKIIMGECGWKGQGTFVRSSNYKELKRNTKPKIFLVTVPKANQAQVRIGRFLNKGEFEKKERLTLLSDFIGGGFTSVLMQELRVKRGLTYSVGAFAAGQKDYGRSQIATFTKVQTLGKLLDVTKSVLEELSTGKTKSEQFELSKRGLVGSYPFKFEDSAAFLSQLIQLDHAGLNYNNLGKFQERVKGLTIGDMANSTTQVFNWKEQTIVVVGPKSLAKVLKNYGTVKVVSYKDYL